MLPFSGLELAKIPGGKELFAAINIPARLKVDILHLPVRADALHRAISQKIRERIEGVFGWAKTILLQSGNQGPDETGSNHGDRPPEPTSGGGNPGACPALPGPPCWRKSPMAPMPRTLLNTLLPPRWRIPAFFDPDWYRRAHPDLARLRGPAVLHWLRHGRVEGRLPCDLPAARAEAALWAGEGAAEHGLEALAETGTAANRLWSRLALARAQAARGDWTGAAAHLPAPRALWQGLGLPGPLALAAEIALHRGDPGSAVLPIAVLRQGFGPVPDWHLLRAALVLKTGDDRAWNAMSEPVFTAYGVPAPTLTEQGITDFDRLQARTTPCPDGPLVSVILPVRDGAATLDTALAGLRAQSWRALEILVVENGSRDSTSALLRRWVTQDGRIRVLDGSREPGAYAARNLALAQARGDFVTLQDADDWSHPDRIRLQMAALVAAPDAVANLSCWVRMSEGLIPSALRPDVAMLHANLSSLLIRREAALRAGFWDRVRAGADSEYIARLRRIFGAGAVRPILPGLPLAFGRLSEGSLTRSARTGLFGAGAAARTAYLAAAATWHDSTPAPVLAQYPSNRPFAAPKALLQASPPCGD